MLTRDFKITTKRTVRTVSGSPRHVSKTHGSHNDRLTSWPHPSDAIDRPPRLPDLTGVRQADRKRGRRHKRATWPRISISKHMYQDAAKDIPRMTVWVVEGRCVHDGMIVSVSTTARNQDEAITNGERVLAYQHMTAIADITATAR